ncbi:MAG: hypothetical protein HY681_10470 [Chloroflexi bacterium]|nr:hypothetical protein [Chloroflexota bacterium]
MSALAEAVLDWLWRTTFATAIEALAVGGALLVFGLLLYCLERRAFAVMSQAFGEKATVVATGWIGTTVHELSHALMCLVFRHKITEISLFSPDTESGVLGYVRHAWDKGSLYQNLGLFFIGIAPLMIGSALLVGLGYALAPGFGDVVETAAGMPGPASGAGVGAYLSWLTGLAREAAGTLFAPGQFRRWQLWAFLYVSVSVASHLSPSPADLRGSWLGLGIIASLLLAVNGALVALGAAPLDYFYGSGRYLGIGAGLMALAVLLSATAFLVSWAVSAVWHVLRGKGMLWPV